MLKEAKKWVEHLEATYTELEAEFGITEEELDEEFEQFWYDGGDVYDQQAWELEAIGMFASSYRSRKEEESEEVETY